jgi:hypothetical protein
METPTLKRSHSCVAPSDTPPPPPAVEAAHKAFKAAPPTDAPTDASKMPTDAQMKEIGQRLDHSASVIRAMADTLKEQQAQIDEYAKLIRNSNLPNDHIAKIMNVSEHLSGYTPEEADDKRYAFAQTAFDVLHGYSTSLQALYSSYDQEERPEDLVFEINGEMISPVELMAKAWEAIQEMRARASAPPPSVH